MKALASMPPAWMCAGVVLSQAGTVTGTVKEPPIPSHVWLLGLDCKFCREAQLTFNKRLLHMHSVSHSETPFLGSGWSPAITVINVINCSYKKQFYSDW